MKDLKLNVLAAKSLSEMEMSEVRGGNCCVCGCKYANEGGSSTNANGGANSKSDLVSPAGGTDFGCGE